ncbi:MAG: carotenoid oxygenase family protein [Pseudomonadota bacterium]
MTRDRHPTRRRVLQTGIAGALAPVAACSRQKKAAHHEPAGWLALLGASEKGGRDYAPRIEGRVPAEIDGALYRNGPGLFERGGHRKEHLLDGDGLIQRLGFSGGKVRYRNEFVKTEKFKAEERVGKLIYPTWTTRAPGGAFKNVGGGEILSQAGVTVYEIDGKIFALDEGNPVYEVDPYTLETGGDRHIGGDDYEGGLKAHAKFDPVSGEWLFVGQSFGREFYNHAFIYHDGALVKKHTFKSPRNVYFHDFLATENYIVFLLHPADFSPVGFLSGMKSVVGSLEWRPEFGNIVAVMSRETGEISYFDAPAAFMWHGLNAFEAGGDIIADFVGYDEPDHFIGEDAFFWNVMDGHMGKAETPGTLRRYVINLKANTLREEIIDGENHEFPMIDPRVATRRHRSGFMTSSGKGALETGVKRVDFETGAQDAFDFGTEVYVGEPVFAARPGGDIDDGWLLAQCLDGESKTTFFALFDSMHVSDGPVAKIWLDHPMPISFHGTWVAG